ncbi:MAG TPA: PVC-type heme-binding CxxCH protein [Prosthecobacter sp.]
MHRSLLVLSAFGFVLSSASALTLDEMNQRQQPMPTVAEKDLPPLKNAPEPFPGLVKHPGFEAHTWVRFPFVENPGSFGFDPKGRLFVAEANRFWRGVPDLRGANELIRGDFQAQTLEDRANLYKTWAARFPATFFTNTADRLIRLEDRDGNGAADHRTLFSDRFKEPLDGLGFSVLAEEDAVYFTCIPSLWKLTDKNDDGVADAEEALVTGFGVKVSFIGHDLHGITRGPDGRLYFSVGDRGYHVTTKDGRVLAGGGRGAIFRCESDGSNFEVFCKGLRNPQELAFDEAGNLFTFDNTGDIGDLARMVYALEGSDSGWDMSHQSAHQYVTNLDWEDFHPKKSMWVAERMYDLFNEEQPQWVYPPASHVARGPSGVTWLTGESLPQDLRGKFLLANYRGASQGCTVLTVGIEAKGAGFVANSEDVFVEGVGVSDVELGYDGNIYLCDFGGGWSINTNGAIEAVTPKDAALKKAGAEVKALFAKGLKEESVAKLVTLLSHADKRVRQAAQFELVNRKETATLSAIAADVSKPVSTRLHGLWALDQLGRQGVAVTEPLLALVRDKEAEIRANAARTLGSVRVVESRDVLLAMLKDESPRVRSLAAVALSRVAKPGDAQVTEALYELAARNGGDAAVVDPVLRHATLTALDLIGTVEAAKGHAQAAGREVRLAALLYLRRHASAEAVAFLKDSDVQIRREAVRAIYDTAAVDGPAGDALAALAPEAASFPPTVQQRIVAANYRRGSAENARNLIHMVKDASLDEATRTAALHGLRLWEKQIVTDPVLGIYRPLPKAERSLAKLGQAIEADLRALLAGDLPAQLSSLALKLASETGVRLEAATLKNFATNKKLAAEVRVAALDSLVKSAPEEAAPVVRDLIGDSSSSVSAAALSHGFALKQDGLTDIARKAIESGPLAKARSGIAGLSGLHPEEIETLWKNRESNKLRHELWLDVFLALQAQAAPSSQALVSSHVASAPDAVFRLSESGGDAKLGENVFRNQGACLQCHKIGSDGGIQGPDLTKVGERLKPQKLIESLVNPNAEIAAGYGLAAITQKDGQLVMGRLTKETKTEVEVVGLDGKAVTISRNNITSIAPPVSAMPPLGTALQPRDLRDLVAFLSSRTSANKKAAKDDASHGDEKIAK